MRNEIICGDCLEVMKQIPDNSVDAVITDPPYGIGFMGKEWDNFKPKEIKKTTKLIYKTDYINGLPVKRKKPELVTRDSRARVAGTYDLSPRGLLGFQKWFQQIAKQCLRVLKPGGFLLSMGGTRTYHRMVCGVEDAGFEIRDTIMWLYGSGFPKSLNIGKQIDKMGGRNPREFDGFAKYIKEKRIEKRLSTQDIAKYFPSKTGGLTGCVWNWENGMNVPTKKQMIILRGVLELDDRFDELIDRVEVEREVIGLNPSARPNWKNHDVNTYPVHSNNEKYLTAPATPEAKEWNGWGTALKPACEPIVVARKPLLEKNVALNVLKWGTGGINIDACRIGTDELTPRDNKMRKDKENIYGMGKGIPQTYLEPSPQGRFPANIILDKQAGQMLDKQSGVNLKSGLLKAGHPYGLGDGQNVYGKLTGSTKQDTHADKGGASRFFYCAKASKSERNMGLDNFEEKENPITNQALKCKKCNKFQLASASGYVPCKCKNPELIKPTSRNNHPTVKPIALMEYLIKLVTRKRALVLDPFIGSGTTAIACRKLSRNFIGIEKEEEYVKIAKARLSAIPKKLEEFT